MKLFQKNDSVKNQYAFKRGLNATVFTAIFIALVVVLNIFVSALADRFPLTLDLNGDLKNSLSSENADFLSSLEKDVYLYVVGSEDNYATYVNTYAYNSLYVTDTTGYYEQTLTLLKEYPKYSGHIHLEFLDITGKDFEKISANYSGFSYGDIFVECESEKSTRRKLVTFSDVYSYDLNYETYSYVVNANNLETALGSAIYSVTLDKTVRLGIPVEYCGDRTAFLSHFGSILTDNNYELVDIEGLNVKEWDASLDGILVFDPKLDFTTDMLNAMDTFLDNDGKKGKSLFYFPSDTTVNQPNLNEFLEEWGISYVEENGEYMTLYSGETTEYPQTLIQESAGSDFTKLSDATQKYIFSDYTLAMERAYETYGNKTAIVVLTSSEGYVLRPASAGDGWTAPDDAVSGVFATAIVTSDLSTDQSANSYAVAFGTSDILKSEYNDGSYSSYIKNMDVVLEIMNKTSGQVSAPFRFEKKQISLQRFLPNTTTATVFRVIFVFVLSLAIVAVGVFVWLRRKNR